MMKLNRQGVLLSAVMLAALLAVIAGPIHRFIPRWQPIYLIGAGFLVALEAGLIHHTFRRERMWVDELAHYIMPEIFIMLILMRVAMSLGAGLETLGREARRWLYDPLSVFDLPFGIAILVGFIIGFLAHAAMRDLFELEPRASEAPAASSEDNQLTRAMVNHDRVAALGRISGRFVFGGALLLVALGVEAVNVERIGGPSQPISALSSGAALLYLVSGFLLYSQARLALLRSRWNLEGAPVAEGVPRRWTRISWLLIAGVAGIAALLPRSYGLGLLTTLQQTLGLIGYGLAMIGYILTSILSLLAILPVLLLSLLTGQTQGETTTTPPLMPTLPAAPRAGQFEPRLLTAVIFWLCMGLLAIYAIGLILQRNPGLVRAVTTRGPLFWLLRRIAWLWRDTRAWAGHATERARALLHRQVGPRQVRIPALRLSRLAPRELIRYFYRSTLRRAAAGGLPRRGGQTPYEYGKSLSQRMPDAGQDIAELTDAFVVAEYSARPIGPDDAQRARKPWRRVHRRLRAQANDMK